jgi:predicted anti-sigma-YlaC factor YlaD
MECDIVEALLRNYKDGLTSAQTNCDIEAHLKECKACRMKLETIENSYIFEDKKQNKKQVTYLLKLRIYIKFLAIAIAAGGWLLILGLIGIIILVKMMFGGGI